MAEATYDIVILGGGIAGAAAAAFAARANRRTCLLTVGSRRASRRWSCWLHPPAVPLLKAAGVDPESLADAAIHGVDFHSADLQQSASCTDLEASAIVERSAVRAALLAVAASIKSIDIRASRTVTAIDSGETQVHVTTEDGSTVCGRLLIVADGHSSATARRLGLTEPSMEGRRIAAAQIDAPDSSKAQQPPGRDVIHLVLNAARPVALGLVLPTARGWTIGVVDEGDDDFVSRRLSKLCEQFRGAAGGFPRSMASARNIRCTTVPCGAALDWETHVGKRALVIGDAGGFVSALSVDGLYPSMLTAQLAVRVADEALNERHEQDALQQFDALWRAELADYIRSPGTDLKFLIPMVFSNAAIAGRTARAFLTGENL
ncbi:MAG: FAD-dependent monooxygenase [Phycisphaerae bacterium]